jgi:hypothetical protein
MYTLSLFFIAILLLAVVLPNSGGGGGVLAFGAGAYASWPLDTILTPYHLGFVYNSQRRRSF